MFTIKRNKTGNSNISKKQRILTDRLTNNFIKTSLVKIWLAWLRIQQIAQTLNKWTWILLLSTHQLKTNKVKWTIHSLPAVSLETTIIMVV